MAIDITGITNENEFYTHHYLSAILESDLKDVFKEWKRKEDEEKIPQPYTLLRGLRKEYFTAHALLEKERKIEDRLTIQREFLSKLFSSLGFQYHQQVVDLDEDGSIPLIGGVVKADGSPELWIIEALNGHEENVDPLELSLHQEQYGLLQEDDVKPVLDIPLEELITRQVFGRTEPPRWVILVNFSQLLLLDRTKWHEKRLLRFDLREILDRREKTTLQAVTALLHKDSICPGDGIPLLDTLDENSHKHAFAVSEDLKYSLRKSIELLGNEAVYYLREIRHEKVYDKENMAGDLTRECLRYMYRLLFLFYIEARPELDYLPNKSEQYRKGYSLESLRDLEMVQLSTEESKNRFFLHESIKILFQLLYEGDPIDRQLSIDMIASGGVDTFSIAPLKSHLFDPKQTPLLNKVKFRNFVLQEVIQLMSLSSEKRGRNSRRGRISYAQLGINQLGAVYEALLSYQGFFAETKLYEVKKAKEKHNVLETAYFVKEEDLEQYTEDERVYNKDGSLTTYEKGTFIYRLAGRDREKSASYYTPEVLTKCLVKYALKELLKDKTADEILHLTVCEPAMGSAAFLNEAVNQLAKAYLDLKQKELGQLISHEEYPQELQKVKMYIADNNVYGVDLNPVAVELAEVSLWLNTIYKGAFVPWFGMQLVCGNSLIGARRQVFSADLLKRQKRGEPSWLDEVPVRVMPGDKRDPDTVYHFLLPDRGMANYKDKVIKQMAGDKIKVINEWRKEFTEPFTDNEIEQLKKLSVAIDKLWQRHADMQRDINNRTTDPLQVFGQPAPGKKLHKTTTEEKDRILQKELFSKDVRNSSPYRRLKLVMDYWCALWFWPIQKAELLPSRAEYLFDLTLLIEGNLYDAEVEVKGQRSLFPDTRPRKISVDMVDEFGFVNIDKLCEESSRLRLVRKLGERYRFLHWELEFSKVLTDQKGFDLVLGNPPWIKLSWDETGVLSDFDPSIVVKKISSSNIEKIRDIVFDYPGLKKTYIVSYEEAASSQNYLGGLQNYDELKGMKTNLFKCFLPLSWKIANKNGYSAFIHPEGVFDDSKGGTFRSLIYDKLIYHFQFQNQFILFPIAHRSKYSINIYSNNLKTKYFLSISNLFHPKSVDLCFDHDGIGDVVGLKDSNNNWAIEGHYSRIIKVCYESLTIFSKLCDEEGTKPSEARLPVIHSSQIMSVLGKFSSKNERLESLKSEYSLSFMWDETKSQKDGIIKRETRFVDLSSDLVLSGPHFYVGTPFYKTPRNVCTEKGHYDVVDLEEIGEKYLPRTNYNRHFSIDSAPKYIPFVPWKDSALITDYYRVIFRTMLPPPNERTLIGAIFPPGVAHTNACQSYAFAPENLVKGITFASACFSIPYDFVIKSTGRTNLHHTLDRFPIINEQKYAIHILLRGLLLNCLTDVYSDLWSLCWNEKFYSNVWAKNDPRLNKYSFKILSKEWNKDYPFVTHFLRRQALVEIDVLTSMFLTLTLDELKTIYRIQFPVLNQNENDTWYDKKGQIVFTCSKGLPGVGFPRKKTKTEPIGWEDIKDMQSGTVERTIIDDTQPGGPVERTITYHAPFDRCDRERDYEEVWANFEKRFALSAVS